MMGSPPNEKGQFGDEVQHEVEHHEGFSIWAGSRSLRKNTGRSPARTPTPFKGPKLPVETVSWTEAKEFCRLLSLKEGKGGKDGKGADGYRLPTEAEWEMACRAGTKTPFHFGETISREQANFYDVKKNEPVAVGEFAANAWGLHDMHGNVGEWCEDIYIADYVKNTTRQDPLNVKGGERRVVRGGGWGSDGRYCRSAARLSHEERQFQNVGIRVALPAAE